ncbi:serpin B11-like [Ahaetulla prasina]|uniref:serpin B11-like n=1 Tax=Ahaetulla prasina TaxID=499056 RepID=UPI0026491716|nr:serpin B11-like [Ahaetulla prasina]
MDVLEMAFPGPGVDQDVFQALHFWKWAETVTPTDGPHSGTDCDKPGGFHSQFKQILTVLNQHSKHHMLRIGCRLYGSNTYDYMERYIQCTKELYNSELERVDFMNATEEAREKINSWVERQTNGDIKNLFRPNSIDPSTAMILLNAASFKGEWKSPFNPRDTHRGVFWTCKDQSIYVEMMTQRGRFNVANISNPPMQVLELPYANSVLSMYIFLPAKHLFIDEVIMNLSSQNFQEWTRPENMRIVSTKIYLPKFEVQNDHSLKSVFSKMGVRDLFIPGKADLSGMTGNTQSLVSRINQSVIFTVNEEGAEAAGASPTAVVDGTHPEIKVNRDFFFVVKHKETGIMLFLGMISEPKWPGLP